MLNPNPNRPGLTLTLALTLILTLALICLGGIYYLQNREVLLIYNWGGHSKDGSKVCSLLLSGSWLGLGLYQTQPSARFGLELLHRLRVIEVSAWVYVS